MRVLVACEFSGIVREAFRARGHDAVSCDLLPTEIPGPHYQGHVEMLLAEPERWDMMIAFPPCTDLSVINASHWAIKQADGRQQAALELVRSLMLAPIRHIAIENPVGRISTALRPPDQIVNPYEFGDPWAKRTCLWLLRLPLLRPTCPVEPQGHWVDGGNRIKGKDQLGPDSNLWTSPERTALRVRTFQGIADAMADQWGSAFAYQETIF